MHPGKLAKLSNEQGQVSSWNPYLGHLPDVLNLKCDHHELMKITLLGSLFVVLFSSSLSARLEWPNANPEGGLCGINYTDDLSLACPEGFRCDLSEFSKHGYGVCRRLADDLVNSADAEEQDNTARN